jgi:putative membrane protein
VVLIVRWLGVGAGGQAPAGKVPLDILKERFARGEIDKAEFEDRRRVLGE